MNTQKLYAIQERLAKKVRLVDGFEKLERIAGSDLAYSGKQAYCAVAILAYSTMKLLEERAVEKKINIPYIPTFLAFRELEPVMEAIKGLEFDVLILDGQGIAHPRGLGIASHVGVLADVPTIGVAKSRLCGEVKEKLEVGKPVALFYEGRQVGYALRTKRDTKPIYVSPGHKVSLESSIEIVQACLKKHKLPEPTRIAHQLAENAKREKTTIVV
ncbi:MAG: endonuclease V [Candidatus Hydrothermarchaeales archaeon]